ncbi:MAG: RepB family DNA primase, partial [Planctomycetes bacterium]|nr:RepB family DNA primase [Planctomycetota bacterium]
MRSSEPAEGGRPAADVQLQFFQLLFAGLDGFVEIRVKDPDSPPDARLAARAWIDAGELERAPAAVGRLTAKYPGTNLYFGVAVRAARGRASKSDLAAAWVSWVDLDGCGEAELGERLAAAGLDGHPPSVVIWSGGGFHLYWLLREPIRLDEEGVARLEAINRGLCAAVRGDFRACDATRILRPPATVNYPDRKKREAGRVEAEVRLVSADPERRYAIDEFALHEERGRKPEESTRPAGPGYDARSWDGELPERAAALLETHARLRARVVDGLRDDLQDQSDSGVDMSVATMLAMEGLPAEEVGDACQLWRRERGGREKHQGYW